MNEPTIALLEYLRNSGVELDGDFLRESIVLLTRLLMEAEVSEQIGAERYERSEGRVSERNGYRERGWETRVGEIPLRIPKLRRGAYFPSFLKPRRRAERALIAVIQSAYVEGVSTRMVDELVQALGLSGVDKSRVSRMCRELGKAVTAFRQRPLEAEYPYLWLDALYVRARQDHWIVNMAIVIAIGVRESGEREILAIDVGGSEDGAFWKAFLRGLVSRGLKRVQLVTSDAHEGLKGAIATVLSGAGCQRCRVHIMRNVLAYIPKREKSIMAAGLRTSFAQPSQEAARQQLAEVHSAMKACRPKAAVLAAGAEAVQYGLPAGTLVAGLFDQPAGAPEPGGAAAHHCGGHLSQCWGGVAPGGLGADRDVHRVAIRTAILQPPTDAQAEGADGRGRGAAQHAAAGTHPLSRCGAGCGNVGRAQRCPHPTTSTAAIISNHTHSGAPENLHPLPRHKAWVRHLTVPPVTVIQQRSQR